MYLIDATAFCYRAFYALPELTTSTGQPTNAIYGFIRMLNKILTKEKPEFLGACFDVSRNTFRQKKFAEYKIQRPAMPESLSSQMDFIKQVIAAYGIKVLEKEGYEADDIIAALSKKAKQKGMKTTIISSDKDILQLVDSETQVYSPHKDEDVVYDEEKVRERFSVSPGQIPDILALMGDNADNIPGAKGIGEKTAVELVREFGSVENLIGKADSLHSEKLRKIIRDNFEQITLSKELAVLNKDIDTGVELEELRVSAADYQQLFKIFKHLEFKKLLQQLPAVDQEKKEVNSESITDSALKDVFKDRGELILYSNAAGGLALGVEDKIFQLADIGKNSKEILSDPSIKKVGHDLKKMKVSFVKENILLEGLLFDIAIAAHLIDPAAGNYELTELALEHLSEKVDVSGLNPHIAVDLIRKLKKKLEDELREKSLLKLFSEIEMPLVEVLARMELNGIKLDLEVLKKLSRDLEIRLIKLIEDIYDLSGTQFNINSPKQLREILFEKLKLPVVKRSKTGASTDEEVLHKLSGKHKLPALLLEYRQLTKLKNTYVDALPELVDKKSGYLHTSFNQTVTETGRLSSSNPNLQNIPIKTDIGRNIRRAIIALNQDSNLFSCDYSQVELRVLAHLSQDEELIRAFSENADIHRATAALIYGLPESLVSDEMRETAKRVNFGIVYGLTAYGLSRDLHIGVDEAQHFINAYFLRYPKVQEYIQGQIKKAQQEGFVTTIFGRRRYIPEINNKNQGIRSFAERQAVNTPIQGSAADMIKLAMIHIDKELTAKGLKTKMLLQIHDELLFDVPEKEEEKIITLIRDKMEHVLKLDVPVRVSIKKGKNWLEMEEVK